MSGITGIFRRDGKDADPADIKKMNDKIAHRGPDGSHVWCEGPVALGHQMLHTTQESLHEILPFEDEESGLVITADARIDNRKDLAPQLGIEDNEYVSDSYFILKAYEKWGEKCPEELLGDFAFAIWDKNKERLFCARDHMGVKPFYYYLSDEVFVFGTEIKVLFSIPQLDKKINELQIAFFLGLIYVDREITSYENVYRLTAANALIVNLRDFLKKQYWKLDPNFEITFDSDEEYVNAFHDIFTEAVRCRLRSAFSVGSMLSGGLDSSSICCTAQMILGDESKILKTFSACFDSVKESNEHYYIGKVLSSASFDSYHFNADEISPLECVDNFFRYGDQFLIPPNTFMIWNIFQEANKNGARILLDGLEGDMTVSHGKGFLIELARRKKWKKLFSEVDLRSKKLHKNTFIEFLRIILIIVMPSFLKQKKLMCKEKRKQNGSNSRIIRNDFSQRLELIDTLLKINKMQINIDNAHEQHYMDINSAYIQYEMEMVDWMSTSFSVESRHPFFDKRLVEFCLAIPTEQKFNNGWDRLIMRRAMSDILPIEVQWREGKANLGHNFRKNLLKYESQFLERIFNSEQFPFQEYVDIKKLREIYHGYKNGDEKDVIHIWDAVIIAMWLNFNDSHCDRIN